MLQNPIFLICCFVVGILYQFLPIGKKEIYKSINKFIIYVPMPAIALTKIPFLVINNTILYAIGSAWICFLLAIVYAYTIYKFLGIKKETAICIILACGLCNTSFIGYPILRYFYGESAIQYAIFVDQAGTFLIMSTLGILLISIFGNGKFSISKTIIKLVSFPPFIFFIVALFIPKNIISGNVFTILSAIGSCMIPLALLSLGMQFNFNLKTIEWKPFLLGMFYKLILIPSIVTIIYFFILHKHGEIYTIATMEIAMPPMITSSLLAAEYNFDKKLAAVFPTLGILFSIPTLHFWHYILKQINT